MRPVQALLAVALALAPLASAHDEVTPKPKLLQKGVPQRQLSAHRGDGVVFKVNVPLGSRRLVIHSQGGTGDCDLYARANVHPSTLKYDATSSSRLTNEKIVVENPLAGPWYILVDAFEAFQGVSLTATYRLDPAAVSIPRTSLSPGVHAGSAKVKFAEPPKGTVIRYTVDGTEPTSGSLAYKKPLLFTQDTRLRAKAFRKAKTSLEFDGNYFVVPPGEVTPLASTVALHHRAGATNGTHLFKIAVPAGQPLLRITTEGGVGEVDVLVKNGAVPTSASFDARGTWVKKTSLIDIPNPTPGDWFISLRGKTAFARYSLMAFIRPPGVDLIAWAPVLEPYLTTETFTDGPDECEVQEGLIEPGTHRLLRFNTETRNIGAADLEMPSPISNPDFEWQECHGHYHFKGFASYRLLNSEGTEVATGRKVSFCLLDLERWDPTAAAQGTYDCSEQGIQSGWADVYDSGLPGQWIDVTDVPNGTYTLEVTMNPQQLLPEADYTNNSARIQVEIGPEDSGISP